MHLLPVQMNRLAAQTTIYEILTTLVPMIAPVLTFTAEEVWQYMPKTADRPQSVQLAEWPEEKTTIS